MKPYGASRERLRAKDRKKRTRQRKLVILAWMSESLRREKEFMRINREANEAAEAVRAATSRVPVPMPEAQP